MIYNIHDGSRVLRFDGVKLAQSSSWRPGNPRWIEFALYKTSGGTYVLHRVGVSMTYHSSVCSLVRKYGLHEISNTELDPNAVPCELCGPSFEDPLVYPEIRRDWTLTTDDASAIVDSLYRDDDSGRYLTRVAERLLDHASEKDSGIDAAYRVIFID